MLQIASEWQPIETAPKDEEPILLFHRRTGGGHPAVAFWDVCGWRTVDWGIRYPEKHFTHWLPIPPLPEEGE